MELATEKSSVKIFALNIISRLVIYNSLPSVISIFKVFAEQTHPLVPFSYELSINNMLLNKHLLCGSLVIVAVKSEIGALNANCYLKCMVLT